MLLACAGFRHPDLFLRHRTPPSSSRCEYEQGSLLDWGRAHHPLTELVEFDLYFWIHFRAKRILRRATFYVAAAANTGRRYGSFLASTTPRHGRQLIRRQGHRSDSSVGA